MRVQNIQNNNLMDKSQRQNFSRMVKIGPEKYIPSTTIQNITKEGADVILEIVGISCEKRYSQELGFVPIVTTSTSHVTIKNADIKKVADLISTARTTSGPAVDIITPL